MRTHNKNQVRKLSSIGLSGFLLLALSLSACQQASNDDANNPAVNDNQTTDTGTTAIGTAAEIPTKIQFPQYIKGFPALLHPITPISTSDSYEVLDSIKSRDEDYYQPIFEERNIYTYRSYMNNLVFENIETGATKKLLPNNDFIIHQVFLPYTVQPTENYDRTLDDHQIMDDAQLSAHQVMPEGHQAEGKDVTTLLRHVIYHVNETPYIKDDDDKPLSTQQALYMSDDMGNALIKLHPDNEFVQQTKWMPQVSRYYFITQSDSNDDGMIDEKDAYHNYEINFAADKPVVRGYEF